MKVEIFYFDGCPNHWPALERVKEILKQEGVRAKVSEIKVPDEAIAQTVGFLGSPTVRIDGLDIEPSARSSQAYGMMCRTYSEGGRREGVPSRELIRASVREALDQGSTAKPRDRVPEIAARESRRASVFLTSSLTVAIVASFCCILPIVFVLTGVTVLGASAAFAAWRPYLLAATFALLGLGFYFAYRPVRQQCEPGSVCGRPIIRGSSRAMIWLATSGVIGFAAFPYYSAPVARFLFSKPSVAADGEAQPAPQLQHASFFSGRNGLLRLRCGG